MVIRPMTRPPFLKIFAFSGLSLLSVALLTAEPKQKEKKKQRRKDVAVVPGEMLVEGFEMTVFAEPFKVEYPTALGGGGRWHGLCVGRSGWFHWTSVFWPSSGLS